MPDPIIEKSAGDNIPFVHDWSKDLARLSDTVITESHWNVDVGSITVGADGRASFIAGPITGCTIQGGTPDEYCVLNNSILLNTTVDPDTGDKLVRRFIVHILDGQWEPMTPPVVVLPDGLADIATLEAFRGATPGVSIWVDTTSNYPAGDLYYAVPDSFTGAAVDGVNVVQGQSVKWFSIHSIGSYTGVLPSRRIDTTLPLTGGGDLSANRTLAVSALSDIYDGVVSKITAANRVLVSSSYNVASWMQISDAYISSISWSKISARATTLTGYGITDAVSSTRTINTTGPLSGGGALSSDLTLSISAASTSSAGSMSASDKTKLDGLVISGTPNVLAKFTGTTTVGNSHVSDDGTSVSVTKDAATIDSAVDVAQLLVRGSTNTNLRLALMVDTTSNVGIVQAGNSGVGELPLAINPKGAGVGFGTTTPTTTCEVKGSFGLVASTLLAAPSTGKELVQRYSAWGGQIIARHGGGYGDEAITHANSVASSIQAPKIQKLNGTFATTGPGNYTQVIPLNHFGASVPANRTFMATLKLTQRLDAVTTSGIAIITLIAGEMDSSGNLDSVYITTTPMVAGPGGTIAIVVAVVSSNQFSFIVNNTASGTITGFWQIELAWVGA